MSRLKTAFITALLALVVPLTLDAARAPDWKHEDIWLKNEQGQRITPTRNSADAYSPHRTCGTCHGYMTITSGTHFQQGFDEMKDGYDPKRPWVLSPGIFGKGGAPGTFTERVAAKKNTGPRDMGLSTYDWIAAGGKGQAIVLSAGNLHPGGGPLEYGRKADGQTGPCKKPHPGGTREIAASGRGLHLPLHPRRKEPFQGKRCRRGGLPDMSHQGLSA